MEKRKVDKLTFYFGVEQGTQEWLDLRANRVTCSNAYKLLTRGKNFCIEDNRLAAKRLTPNGNQYAERGHVVEEEARNEFNKLLEPQGYRIETCTFITNDDYPEAGYSPDGLIVPLDVEDWLEAGEFIPLECKAYNDVVERWDKEAKRYVQVRVDKHLKAVEDYNNVPISARMQIQMEMLMVGAKTLVLLLANPDADDAHKVHFHYVQADEKIQEKLSQRLSPQKTFKKPSKNP